ncbi:hypothetical protein LOCC1_G003451 [Lachnellula occidentalis]|uniref:Transcription factor domain-containing protein n=1 Tax=Lachnellula occidentalis TaxID=215460 RepID=A0A8H8S3E9_9HELO|nr:hypothetical protein LOCC1_G003451 [Lachnellula occidentalis]
MSSLCSRARRNCPGYQVNKDRKFINYLGEADFDLLHQKSGDLLRQTADPTHRDTLYWPNIEKDALTAFFNDYCIVSSNRDLSRGFLHGLQTMICQAGPQSELSQACTIIALTNLGRKLENDLRIKRAKGLYSLLLRSFRLSISDSAQFTTLESLITAALLGLYEVITSTDTYPGAHVGHARGVSAILLSKFSPFELLCRGKLFQVPSPILLDDLEPENTPFSSLPSCSTIPNITQESFSIMCTPFFKQSGSSLDVIYGETEPLVRKAISLLRGEATLDQIIHLKLEAECLREAYKAWPETTPQEWRPRTVGAIASKNDGVTLLARNTYVASIWNSYRKACLLVLDIILSCHRRVNNCSEIVQSEGLIHKEITQCTEGIVSSIPYLLAANLHSFIENATAGSPALVPGRPVGGLLSMQAFYILSTLPTAEPELKTYMRDCLAWIGTRMGIGQATILSKCTTIDEFHYATEARVIIWAGMLI